MSKKKSTDGTVADTTVETPTETVLTIQGIVFRTPLAYAVGHVVNDVEAHTLNQTRGENLRNNFAKSVKTAVEAAAAAHTAGTRESAALTPDELSALDTAFQTYASTYIFQGTRRASAPVDPVGREAHKIAKSVLDQLLAKKNIDKKTLAEGKYEELLLEIQAKRPDIREEAQRRVDMAKAAASSDLDDLLS